ncbi:MAG: phosphate signaling complex protein PhoU [Bdellovibrionales bacterium]
MEGQNRKNDLLSPGVMAYNQERRGGSMVRHIDSELQSLKDLALQMGGCVEKAYENACKAIAAEDRKAIEEVHRHESRINDFQILVDEACVSVLAKQAPVAKDLRLVIAISKINTDLERMGDQTVNIVHGMRDLYALWPDVKLPVQIQQMMEGVGQMIGSVLDAFSRRDVELSEKVLAQDDHIDDLKDQLVREMTTLMKAGPEQVETGLTFIMISKNLERMADHATNIAEEVIYLATGNDIRHGHTVSVNS